MQVRSTKHLGALVRARRHELDLSQARLAQTANVSRQWVVAFEAGKPTAELGHVMRVVRALDLKLDLSPAETHTSAIDIDRLVDG